MSRFEPHCHLSGLLTPADVCVIDEEYGIAADLPVVGDGAAIVQLARQGPAALATRWVMRPRGHGTAVGMTGWQRFQAHAAVAAQVLLGSGSTAQRWHHLQAVAPWLLRRQAARWQQQDVSQAEVRVHVQAAPMVWQEHYLAILWQTCQEIDAAGLLRVRLRLTLPRQGWQRLAEPLLSAAQANAAFWAGWDWSGVETQPTHGERFARLPAPVAAGRSIHAGEQLAPPRPLLDALRHPQQAAARWGAQRLGHASVLGVDLAWWLDRRWDWAAGDVVAARAWGQDFAPAATIPAALLAPRGVYTPALVAALQELQAAVIADVRRRGTVLEVCPTSNARIVAEHGRRWPLPGLLTTGLPIVIGSDDPGLLDTSLPREQYRARQVGWVG